MLVETPLHDYRHYPLHASGSVVTRTRSRQKTAIDNWQAQIADVSALLVLETGMKAPERGSSTGWQ